MSIDFAPVQIAEPEGSFWNFRNVGQKLTAKVKSFSPDGGTTATGQSCPQLVLELIEPGTNATKEGPREVPAGTVVTLQCGQVRLRRGVEGVLAQFGSINPGDLIQITMTGTQSVANGTMKVYSFGFHSAAQASEPQPQPQPQVQAPQPQPQAQVVEVQGAQPQAPQPQAQAFSTAGTDEF